ncbi:polyketide synthase dehydratase domain-containing protein, partial [Spongiactinospora sp. TRM90649]
MVLTGRLSVAAQPWLADHVVMGSILVPGTAFVELALRAGEQVGCPRLEELTIEAPLVLPERGTVTVQVTVGAEEQDGRRPVALYSRPDEGASWVRHAGGVLGGAVAVEAFEFGVWPPAGAVPVDVSGLYEGLASAGLAYGPVFRGVRSVWRGEPGVVFAEVVLPDSVAGEAGVFGLHPALLDAALQVVGVGGVLEDSGARLPFVWSGVSLLASGASVLRVRVAASGGDGVSVSVADASGVSVAVVESLVLRPVSERQVRAAGSGSEDSLFEIDW